MGPASFRVIGGLMKKIEAVIRPCSLKEVKEALKGIGIHGMTITDALGSSRGEKNTFVYGMAEYEVEFVKMLKLEMVLDDEDAEAAMSAIFSAARTGKPGDGKVWVSSLEGVARIRAGEWNANAI
jgi:nitrogen regulatory protein P-II 1